MGWQGVANCYIIATSFVFRSFICIFMVTMKILSLAGNKHPHVSPKQVLFARAVVYSLVYSYI